jgi:cytidylate kinase
MRKPRVIALDGPAASGKGTLARLIAEHYKFAYLDTGTLYRGVAYLLLREGEDPRDEAAAERVARDFSLDQIAGAEIRGGEVGRGASVVAAHPKVRQALLEFQREFARRPPCGAAGAVLDGRDIGTVVCPEADVKFYVIASPEVRARRRFLELEGRAPGLSEAAVLADLRERDARDAARAVAPMARAADAELLDTTHLTIEAAFAAARRVIDGVFQRCKG